MALRVAIRKVGSRYLALICSHTVVLLEKLIKTSVVFWKADATSGKHPEDDARPLGGSVFSAPGSSICV